MAEETSSNKEDNATKEETSNEKEGEVVDRIVVVYGIEGRQRWRRCRRRGGGRGGRRGRGSS